MEQLQLKISSLVSVVFESKGTMVVLPGLQGDIGILPGDRLFVYALKSGIIYLFDGNKVIKRLFIFDGTFSANDNILSICTARNVIDLDSFDKADAQKHIDKYQELITHSEDKFTTAFYEEQIQKYNLLLESININNYK